MDLSNLLFEIKAKWEVRAKVWRCLCMVWSLNCSKSCRELCETTPPIARQFGQQVV